jgi:hypothetical protein
VTPGSLTPLQLDPLGGMTARLITLSCVITAVVVAVAMSLAQWQQVAYPALQVLALLTLVAASVLMIVSTSPYRAPLSRGRMAIIWSTLALASVLDVVSQWGTNTSVRGDWGPIAFAIVILMSGSYRSAREILRMTLGATVVLLALGAIEIAPVLENYPARYVVSPLIVAAPVLATGIAAAAFSRTQVVHLLAWRGSAASAQRDVIDDLRSGLMPSVRDERLAMLNAEVVPFLRRVVDRGELRAEDSDLARELAGSLRAVMLPESGRNWLESVVDEVIDPEQLAERMGNEQRGSLKALLSALRDSGLATEGSIAVRIRSQETTAYLQLTAPVIEAAALRTALAPYFVVARSFFPRAVLDIDRSELLLQLHYPLG